MKKIGLVGLCLVLLISLTACGDSFKAEENSIYVKDNGSVVEASIETFEEAYYKKDELEAYVKDIVDAYTKEHGKDTVSISELEVKDKLASLYLKFKKSEDFAKFRGIEFFNGEMPEAMAKGYTLAGKFYKVENGKLGKEVTTGDMEDDLNIVITKEPIPIKTDDSICYVSGNMEIKADDYVVPIEDTATGVSFEDEYYIVIYK